ncbi:peptide deformylase [Clostridium fermenticellae]|uniref:Peptide deformylase n=1 Tax=Clostridium fermenticellae TaxID=2068654 RepID=A0A386H391_9CLOT|nr:peptide deformylase [Clostridium fermenticellae]AYD40013.1 peptide deformylase [Clostridium fermenticellae]
MALRNIRKYGDEILRKKSRKVDKIDDRIITLLDDMQETMYDSDGVGLAAPQVGILKRMIVIDVGDGIIRLINPSIMSYDGNQVDEEGCLSIPGESKEVNRPYKVKVKALNEDGEDIIIEAEGLLARALCHEIDHLDGILFIDKAVDKNEK